MQGLARVSSSGAGGSQECTSGGGKRCASGEDERPGGGLRGFSAESVFRFDQPPCCQFPAAHLADHVCDAITVRDPRHMLVDDGPTVQVLGSVVGGGADDLHAPLVGAVVWLRAWAGGRWGRRMGGGRWVGRERATLLRDGWRGIVHGIG